MWHTIAVWHIIVCVEHHWLWHTIAMWHIKVCDTSWLVILHFRAMYKELGNRKKLVLQNIWQMMEDPKRTKTQTRIINCCYIWNSKWDSFTSNGDLAIPKWDLHEKHLFNKNITWKHHNTICNIDILSSVNYKFSSTKQWSIKYESFGCSAYQFIEGLRTEMAPNVKFLKM